jgi:hypothetical protein
MTEPPACTARMMACGSGTAAQLAADPEDAFAGALPE